MTEARVLIDNLVIPEGPRWRNNELFVSDLLGGEVLAIGLDGKSRCIGKVPQRPSGLGWLPDGRVIVVSMLDRKLLVGDGIGFGDYVDLSPFCEARLNDMAVDAHGHIYIGEFPVGEGTDPVGRIMSARSSKLVLVDASDVHKPRPRIVAEDMRLPNGMVITKDGKTLIVAETQAKQLTAFDIAADGSLTNRRLWADLPGPPDGICMDEAGCIWVASPFPPSSFLRVAQGGKIVDRIALSETAAFACVLGGADGKTLFLLESKYPPDETMRHGRIRTMGVANAGAGFP